MKKIFISLILFIFVISIGVYVVFVMKGKEMLEQKFSEALNREVAIESMWWIPPMGLKINQLTVEGFTPAKEIDLQIGMLTFLKEDFSFHSLTLVEPAFVIERTKEGAVLLRDLSSAGESSEALKISGNKVQDQSSVSSADSIVKKPNDVLPEDYRHKAHIHFQQIIIQRGKAVVRNNYVDEEQGLINIKEASLQDVDVRLTNISFPMRSQQTGFTFHAQISVVDTPFESHQIQGDGWVDFVGKDMDGTLKVIDADQKQSLVAHGVSKNNDMTVNGDVKMGHFLKGLQGQDGEGAPPILSGVLSSMGVEIGAKFSFKTAMDDFKLSNVAFSGNLATK